MPADDARPVLPSRTIGPLASDDPESEPPLRKGEGPGHRPTGQATLASHAARWPLLDGPRTGRRDDLVCAQPRYRGPLARFRPQVRRALLRTHPDPAARPRGAWTGPRPAAACRFGAGRPHRVVLGGAPSRGLRR